MRAAVPLLPTNIRKSENKQKKLTNKPHEPQGLSFYATAEISTTIKTIKTIKTIWDNSYRLNRRVAQCTAIPSLKGIGYGFQPM